MDSSTHAIAFGKAPSSRAACREAFGHHLPGLHPIEEIEEVVGVASNEGASEPDQLSSAAIEYTEVVALSSLLCQLVQFIGDGVVPPALHVAADVPEWGHTLNLLAVGLPNRGKAISPILPACEV